MCGSRAVGADDAELPGLTPAVVRERGGDGRLGCQPLVLQQTEDRRAVGRHTGRLGGHSADTGLHPRDDRADGEVPRLHRAADLARDVVDGDDREGRLDGPAPHRPSLRGCRGYQRTL